MELLKNCRANVAECAVERFFDTLEQMHQIHHFEPWLVANFDETMIEAGCRSSRVLVPRAYPCGVARIPEDVDHMTFGSCIFADGTRLKPLVILPLVHLPPWVDEVMGDNLHFSGTPGAWITRDVFHQYIEKVFLPEVEARRRAHQKPDAPCLLLVDGHSSRLDAGLMQEARDRNVHVVTLVSHASHLMQPLDKGCFRELKARLGGMRGVVQKAPVPERRRALLQHAHAAFDKALTPATIKRAFRDSGMYPVDRRKVLSDARLKTAEAELDETDKKVRKIRTGFKISGQVMTSTDTIAQLRRQQEQWKKKAAKRRLNKQKGAKKQSI